MKSYEQRVTDVVEEELANNLLPRLERLDEPLRRALRGVVVRLAADMESIRKRAGRGVARS
jgi:hypothetical protein